MLQIVRAPVAQEVTAVPPRLKQEDSSGAATPPLPTYQDRVTVTSPRPWWQLSGVSEETAIQPDLASMPGGLVDDPLQSIRSMPRVAPLGDYRSEFVVRASPFRHAEVVVDGVSTSWLRHAPDPTASVSMFTNQVLDSATLRTGAYPRTYSDRLGPQLDLTLREGSRERTHVHGTVANTAVALVGEGPVGQARGSWIAAGRQSLLEWPGEHLGPARSAFGFSDAIAKLVFDVATRQQLGLTLITGRSRVDGEEDIQAAPLAEAGSRTSVVNLSWRSTVGSTTVITQRAYVITQQFNSDLARPAAPSRANQEVVYRPTFVTSMPFGLMEIGAHVGRTTWSRDGHSAAAWTRSGYVHLWSQVVERLTISPGVRASGASHLAGPIVTPWFSAELGAGRRWTIGASIGLSHQLPEVGAHALPSFDRTRPESAAHLDVSIRRQLTANLRWQATVYWRRERSILDASPLLEEIDPVNATAGIRDEGRLAGSAHGLEILMAGQSPSGFSGWAAYAYGRARQSDPGRGNVFWADFDQRHAMTAFGVYRWRNSTNLGATLRIGSGVPIPGYLSSRGTDLFIGTLRNAVRLPTYARLDVRAGRSFAVSGQRLHVFAEAVNLLDRVNVGAAAGSFEADGRAVGFIEPLTPARAAVGVTVGF